jgi:hypothetical protein
MNRNINDRNAYRAIPFLVLLALLTILGGCKESGSERYNNGLLPINATLNEELEKSAMASNAEFKEFKLNFTPNPLARFDFAIDDVFSISGESFNSLDAAVLGVMLGDSYQDVLERLGVPDVMFVPTDKSYRNLEYGKKIGIGGSLTAITYHIEDDTVTRISMRQTFAKYLVGNTSIGQTKEYLYDNFDVPDYQSFTQTEKVHHYVEKGIEFYINRDELQIISLIPPRDFKGVEYRTVPVDIGGGIFANVTKPFLKE